MKKRRARKAFAVIFLTLWAAYFGGTGGWDTYRQLRLRNFLPVEGVVTHSEVGVSNVGDGIMYYPDIRFRYTVDGRQYDGGKYRIVDVSTSGRSGKSKIVERHPVGSRVTGYYDPDDPSVAVIDRSFNIVPPIFLVIGIGVLIGAVALYHRGASSAAGGPDGHGLFPIERRRDDVHLARFSGIADWPLTIPVFATVKMALARLKFAAPSIVASAQPLRVGEPFEIAFEQRARSRVNVEKVSLTLICREIAASRRATGRRTDAHDVYTEEMEIARRTRADRLRPITGRMRFRIPDDAMHSFSGLHNRVAWLIEVHTAATGWPDYSKSFELQVAPARASAAGER